MWAQPGSTRDKATTTPLPRDSHRHSGRRNHHQVHHHHHHTTTTTTLLLPLLPTTHQYHQVPYMGGLGRPAAVDGAHLSRCRCRPRRIHLQRLPSPTPLNHLTTHPPSSQPPLHPPTHPPTHPPSSLHPLLTARPPACGISHSFISTPLPSRPPQAAFKHGLMQVPPLPPHHCQHPPPNPHHPAPPNPTTHPYTLRHLSFIGLPPSTPAS